MEENTGGTKFVSFPKKTNITPLHASGRPPQRPPEPTCVARFASAEDAVLALKPTQPVHALREQSIHAATAWFLEHFPGDVMFAVKTNPEPIVLDEAYAAGMRHFDVASLVEAELVFARFGTRVTQHFMHPVKSREAIAKAYYYYGIRHFSLDSFEELEKILSVTENAPDLSLSVRLKVANDKAAYSLGGKFGVSMAEAPALLRATRSAAHKLGICFHVGSQCMDPSAFISAMDDVGVLLANAGVKLDILDIGGGFPSIYPDKTPPAMMHYMEAIGYGLQTLTLDNDCQIFCEPGRALVAEAGSLLVRVELRKGEGDDAALYINDGVYGSLFDAGSPGFVYPTKAIRPGHHFSCELVPFKLYGPTCDSVDAMAGPFMLPSDITEGDWIEIGQMGAYGATMRTKFNGFYSDELVTIEDQPLLKMDME